MRPRGPQEVGTAKETQRLDKWLWFTRLVKTRTLATDFVLSGKVRVNRARVDKPSYAVRVDDVLTVVVARRVRVLKVLGLGLRRGPAPAARTLYEELTAGSVPLKPQPKMPVHEPSTRANDVGPGQRPSGAGRPTKKERRDIERLNAKIR
ncbi:MAG: RNA-binding S4 domain-containing protein [Hyphomicrobium sp.]